MLARVWVKGHALVGRRVFFRFAAALILVVLISLVGIGLEKQTLETKRAVSRQYFQKDLLLEMYAQQRLRIQQLTTPADTSERTRRGRLHRSAVTDRPEVAR